MMMWLGFSSIHSLLELRPPFDKLRDLDHHGKQKLETIETALSLNFTSGEGLDVVPFFYFHHFFC
jgi:hypothetical protein